MKVILYMEITGNGYIAKEDNDASWVSEEAWQSYLSTMKGMNAIIIGRNTYNIMPEDEFQKGITYVVMTKNPEPSKKSQDVLFTHKQPEEILKMLEEKGKETVCIAGGGTINSLFMQAGLIHEIYLDIEPIMFGKGIQLFSKSDFEYNLELLESKKLNDNTIQLHYKVI